MKIPALVLNHVPDKLAQGCMTGVRMFVIGVILARFRMRSMWCTDVCAHFLFDSGRSTGILFEVYAGIDCRPLILWLSN